MPGSKESFPDEFKSGTRLQYYSTLFNSLEINSSFYKTPQPQTFSKCEQVDRTPQPHKDAPWPVKQGGIILTIYQNSLSLVFILLFVSSFLLHAHGTMLQMNEEDGTTLTMVDVLAEQRFWFESFQNWQSEFLSVAAIVFFSIYLRQKGSPESKPVDSPHEKTGG